ncbi:MBL fold metallo-hydrolase [Arthrobacter rhombi]|uniref:MBL fold metallo-hydrolase n=1 Tax=Arthrobacter rhombi TaxID=71253 RepID=UPI003FD35132
MSPENSLLHDLAEVTIRRVSVSSMDNNAYLITHKRTGAQVLIDAADEAAALRGLIQDAAADASVAPHLELIATTHQHWDHVRALRELADETGARTACGAEDTEGIRAATGVEADVILGQGDIGNFEGFDLRAVHLRGHTPGSIAYIYEDPSGPTHIFSGDSLFPGGLGNTEGDTDRFASLYEDVSERLFGQYPDDSFVHPGHGQGTTLGAERPQLPEWKQRGW